MFNLELNKQSSTSLASRLRQVFEYLTQGVLESIFVNN